jgi:protein-tyrosine-phosphatase
MAEIIFLSICKKRKRENVVVKSAGTNAEVGADMTMDAKIALLDSGFKIPKKRHSATQFDDKMMNEFDHIICMNNSLRGKNIRQLYIADPWQCGLNAYYEVVSKLKIALDDLYKELFNE